MIRHRLPKGYRWNTFPAWLQAAVATITANVTNTYHLGGPYTRALAEHFAVSCQTVPIDADGTLLLTFKKWDASAAAAVTLTTAFNIEGLVTKAVTRIATIAGLTEAQLRLDPGDTLYAEIVSNSAAIDTAAVGLQLVAELLVLE